MPTPHTETLGARLRGGQCTFAACGPLPARNRVHRRPTVAAHALAQVPLSQSQWCWGWGLSTQQDKTARRYQLAFVLANVSSMQPTGSTQLAVQPSRVRTNTSSLIWQCMELSTSWDDLADNTTPQPLTQPSNGIALQHNSGHNWLKATLPLKQTTPGSIQPI